MNPIKEPNDFVSPESEAWSTPISEEWNSIYSKFLEATRAMIERAGGADKVRVQSYADGDFSQLCLHLNHQGGLIKGERDREATRAA